MADRDLRHRAAEASRLVTEPLFVEALEKIRITALLALAEVDATDISKIKGLQAKAQVCIEIVEELQAAIVAAPTDQPETK